MHYCIWWHKFLYNQASVCDFLLNFPAVFLLYFHAPSAVFPDTAAGHCISAKEREYIMGPRRYMRGGGTYDVCTKTALHQIRSILVHQNVWCLVHQDVWCLMHQDVWCLVHQKCTAMSLVIWHTYIYMILDFSWYMRSYQK